MHVPRSISRSCERRRRDRFNDIVEPVRPPDDLDVAAPTFQAATDLDTLLATTKPYEGPEEFVIADLTDDEWDRFVAALNE